MKSMRVLNAAAIAQSLAWSLASQALGVQNSESGSAGEMDPQFWAIVAVGATLSAIGVSCLVMLVGLTNKVGDVRERLSAVETALNLRAPDEADKEMAPDYWTRQRRRQRQTAEIISHELVPYLSDHLREDLTKVVRQLANELRYRDPPI